LSRDAPGWGSAETNALIGVPLCSLENLRNETDQGGEMSALRELRTPPTAAMIAAAVLAINNDWSTISKSEGRLRKDHEE